MRKRPIIRRKSCSPHQTNQADDEAVDIRPTLSAGPHRMSRKAKVIREARRWFHVEARARFGELLDRENTVFVLEIGFKDPITQEPYAAMVARRRDWFGRSCAKLAQHGATFAMGAVGIAPKSRGVFSENQQPGYEYLLRAIVAVKTPRSYKTLELIRDKLTPNERLSPGPRGKRGWCSIKVINGARELKAATRFVSALQHYRASGSTFGQKIDFSRELHDELVWRMLSDAGPKLLWAFAGLQRNGSKLVRAKHAVRRAHDDRYRPFAWVQAKRLRKARESDEDETSAARETRTVSGCVFPGV